MQEQISLFPYKKRVIENIDVKKLKKAISSDVLTNSNLETSTSNNFKQNKTVEGFFEDNKFTIRRLISFGYSAFPLIVSGDLFMKNGKYCVKLTYRFHYVVNILLTILFCLFLSMFLTDLFPDKYSEEVNQILNTNTEDILFNSFLWVFCFYVITLFLYNYELKKINHFLFKHF